MYEVTLRASPASRQAAEPAFVGAWAYKQAARFHEAIRMYDTFIEHYASERALDEARKDRAEHRERVTRLDWALEERATTHYGFFDYSGAAESWLELFANTHLSPKQRVAGAKAALSLYSSLRDRQKMTETYGAFLAAKLELAPAERAEVDYLRASFDYVSWDPEGDVGGANGQTRAGAIAALTAFHAAHENQGWAAPFALEAAYRVATMLGAAGDPEAMLWFRRVAADWDVLSSHPGADAQANRALPIVLHSGLRALADPYSDYGGEAGFTLVDTALRAIFDYDTGHQRYAGTVDHVIAQARSAIDEADSVWKGRLVNVMTRYGSFRWAAAATAREGSLYASIRRGLEGAQPDFEGAAEPRDHALARWSALRDRYVELCRERSIPRDIIAVLLARRYGVVDAQVEAAASRLALLTDSLGNAEMRRHVERQVDLFSPDQKLRYEDGMFLRTVRGWVPAPSTAVDTAWSPDAALAKPRVPPSPADTEGVAILPRECPAKPDWLRQVWGTVPDPELGPHCQ